MSSKEKKNPERKGRRINYSRRELAEYLHCSENAVDDRLKRINEYYDKLNENSFKKETDNNRNFFPPEYTPFLKILMKEHEINPAAKKRAQGNVTATDLQEYNKAVLEDILRAEDIPDYIKEVLDNLPWIRVSQNIADSTGQLLDELTVFIYLLVASCGNDIGQTIRLIIREVDRMNYSLYRGMKVNSLDTGLSNGNYINRKDVSIDVGLVTIIKVLMENIGLESLQNSIENKQNDFFTDEQRKKLEEMLLDENPEMDVKREADKIEREQYLNSRAESIIESFIKNAYSNAVEFKVQNRNAWESIVERIQKGNFSIIEELGNYYDSHTALASIPKEKWIQMRCIDTEDSINAYPNYYNNILTNETKLRDAIDKMVGQVMVELFAKNQRTEK